MTDTLVFTDQFPSSLRSQADVFDACMQLQGRVVRKVPSRETSQVMLDGKSFFIKKHFGVGWKEIIKNLLSFKLPIISAKNEWDAIKKMQAIGISTTPFVAYGARGIFPATKQSFLLTQDLGEINSLEDICLDWPTTRPSVSLKRKLIKSVASVAHKMHDGGVLHRDFYICHICFKPADLGGRDIPLYVIDLHRAKIFKKISTKSRIKDLAALYFSAMRIGLTQRDLHLFARVYAGADDIGDKYWQRFFEVIAYRAEQLDKRYQRKMRQGIDM